MNNIYTFLLDFQDYVNGFTVPGLIFSVTLMVVLLGGLIVLYLDRRGY